MIIVDDIWMDDFITVMFFLGCSLYEEKNICLWRIDNQSHKWMFLRLDKIHLLVYVDETITNTFPFQAYFFMKESRMELISDVLLWVNLPKIFNTVFCVILLTTLYFVRWGSWGGILGNLFRVTHLLSGPYFETRTVSFQNAMSHVLSIRLTTKHVLNNILLLIVTHFW